MYGKPLLLLLLVLTTFILAEEKRKLQLAGGQLRIINPDSDDSELMRIEASSSIKEKKLAKNSGDTEKVKTLSQQVADGKYGLIQKELFSKPPKRPGILSYDDNPEVPNDNKYNLGGLDKNEIWLAENHLLVLSGGRYPPHEDKKDYVEPPWQPIDNYKAPLHQVKIPAHPKVPPPFPVQLTEDGPLQILGTNFSRPFNETDEPPAYALPPPEDFPQDAFFPPFYPNSTDITSGKAPLPIPVKPSGEYPGGVSFPPSNLNETWPPYFGYLPPGAVILPPPENQTEYDDEDPSIYYPPPYSFFYPKDNFSAVPPGPLVPGIVLPPPPNFFTLLDDTTTQKSVSSIRKSPQRQRKPVTTTKTDTQIHPTTTPLPVTIKTKGFKTEKPIKIYPVKGQHYNNEVNSQRTTTESPKVATVVTVQKGRTYLPPKSQQTPQVQRRKPENVTILRPVKAPPSINENKIPNKPFAQYGPPPTNNRNIPVSTTQVPLKYYTTSNDIEANSVSQEPNNYDGSSKTKIAKTTLKPTQYFFYEEPDTQVVTTPKIPNQQNAYYETTEGYQKPAKPNSTFRQRRPQYIYVTARPYNTQKPRFRFIQQPVRPDSFSIHIAKLQNHIHQYYTTRRPTTRPSPKPVYQYSFQAANYQNQHSDFKPSPEVNQHNNFRPIPQKYNVEIQPAIQQPGIQQSIIQQPGIQQSIIQQPGIQQSVIQQPSPPVINEPPGFRQPPPKYSVEIQQAIEIIPTQAPKYQENARYRETYQQKTPRPEQYYTTPLPDYQFEHVTQKPQYLPTSRPISQYAFEVTPNPVYQGFYTKPDEGFFDENTREYFTVFGRKLPSGTTPLPGFDNNIPDTFASQNQQAQYQEQKPISLESDTVVNYVNPRPNVNQEAELIPINNSGNGPTYPNVVRYPKQQRNQNPEIVKAIEIPPKQNSDGSYISYQLPGDDGAHFYFLTPQLANRRDQGSGFYFEQSNARRIRRNENKTDKES